MQLCDSQLSFSIKNQFKFESLSSHVIKTKTKRINKITVAEKADKLNYRN